MEKKNHVKLKWNSEVMRAAKSGNNLIIQSLLAAGADANAKDNCLRTALYHAALNGHALVCQTLIENGALVDARDQCQRTPLYPASSRGYAQIVKTLLENGAHVNAVDKFKDTPLHLACGGRKKDVISLLIQKGANLEALNSYNEKPLDVAKSNGRQHIIDFILNVLKRMGVSSCGNFSASPSSKKYQTQDVIQSKDIPEAKVATSDMKMPPKEDVSMNKKIQPMDKIIMPQMEVTNPNIKMHPKENVSPNKKIRLMEETISEMIIPKMEVASPNKKMRPKEESSPNKKIQPIEETRNVLKQMGVSRAFSTCQNSSSSLSCKRIHTQDLSQSDDIPETKVATSNMKMPSKECASGNKKMRLTEETSPKIIIPQMEVTSPNIKMTPKKDVCLNKEMRSVEETSPDINLEKEVNSPHIKMQPKDDVRPNKEMQSVEKTSPDINLEKEVTSRNKKLHPKEENSQNKNIPPMEEVTSLGIIIPIREVTSPNIYIPEDISPSKKEMKRYLSSPKSCECGRSSKPEVTSNLAELLMKGLSQLQNRNFDDLKYKICLLADKIEELECDLKLRTLDRQKVAELSNSLKRRFKTVRKLRDMRADDEASRLKWTAEMEKITREVEMSEGNETKLEDEMHMLQNQINELRMERGMLYIEVDEFVSCKK